MKKATKLIKKNIDDCIYNTSIAAISILLLTASFVVGVVYLYAAWYDWIVQTIWHKDINNWWFVLLALVLGQDKMSTLIPTIFSLYILILL
jgi:hypothetical protein